MPQNPNKDLLDKIDYTFPEDGKIYFPKPGSESLMEIIRTGRAFALSVLKHLPHSRERNLAFGRLEECFFWVVRGLMRK